MLGAELAEAVLRFATERHELVAGVDHRLHHAGIAALGGNAVERLVHGNRVRRRLLRGRVVPLAEHFDDIPSLAAGIERFMDAIMTIGVDRGARHAAHFQDLAAVGHMT
jgi:hypothetical protein